tara:strand:- start:42 stop:1394 length:1353 start_codon:yes stop_codon:yes gene_type:complete
MILDEVNENIKVVHFTGPGKTIHEHNTQWINKHWIDQYYDDIEILKAKPFYCPFPFEYVYSEQTSQWRLCSEADDSPHTTNDLSIEEWFTSDYINNIRKEMLSDTPNMSVINKSCFRCVRSEKKTNSSTRKNLIRNKLHRGWLLSKTHKALINNTLTFNETGSYQFKDRCLSVQMRMFKNNDVCNLGCYMCFPKFSTVRQKDLNQINVQQIDDAVSLVDYGLNNDSIRIRSSVDDVIKMIDKIYCIELIGGEPLYIKESFDFIEKLIKIADCSQIKLTIFTNLSVLKNKEKNFIDYIKYFKEIEFKISMDGIGKYNEYIRRRSIFEDLENNIKEIQSCEFDNVKFFIWTTVSMLSIFNYDLVEKWSKLNNVHYEYNILQDPEFLSIIHLPDPIKEKLIIKFKHLPNIVSTLKSPRDEQKFQNAMIYIKKLDDLYKTNVFELFPELEEFTK